MITEGGELIKSPHLAKEGSLMQHRTKSMKLPMLRLLIKHMCVERWLPKIARELKCLRENLTLSLKASMAYQQISKTGNISGLNNSSRYSFQVGGFPLSNCWFPKLMYTGIPAVSAAWFDSSLFSRALEFYQNLPLPLRRQNPKCLLGWKNYKIPSFRLHWAQK